MGRYRKIYINSSHRVSGTSTRFRYELQQDQDCGPEAHVAITSVSLPNAFFSVQTNVNDKLYIYEKHSSVESSSQNRIITIPSGQYSSTSLNTAVQLGLNANPLGSAAYACNYNAITQRITITQSSGGGFTIFDDNTLKTLGRKDPQANGFYGTLPKITNPQSLQQVMNLPAATTPNVTFLSGIITMARVLEAYLRSPNLTNFGTLDPNGRSDVLKRVLLDKDFGYVITTDSNIESSDLMDVSGKTLRTLDFLLTDSHGNQLDLHGLDFSFCLNFIYGPIE